MIHVRILAGFFVNCETDDDLEHFDCCVVAECPNQQFFSHGGMDWSQHFFGTHGHKYEKLKEEDQEF